MRQPLLQPSLPGKWWYPLLTTILPSAVVPVAIAILFNLFLQSERGENAPLHSMLEGVGSLAAILLALFIIMMRKNNLLRPGYLWVATSLMGMGLLDGFHASVALGTAFVWLHSVATFIGGLTFALVVLPESISRRARLQSAPYVIAAFSVIFGIASLLWPEWLPVMAANGIFTLSAELLNIIGGVGFFIAWFQFAWRQPVEEQEERLLLANHCMLFGIAGLLFHFSALWDATWWLWHILRLFAYLVILWFFLDIYNRDTKRVRLAKQIIDNTSEAVVVTDCRGLIIDINKAYEEVTGYARSELIGANPNINKSGRHDKGFYQEMWSTLTSNGQWTGEIWDRRKDGTVFPKWLTINAINDENGITSHYVGLFKDISEKKSLEERLKSLAFYDPLTGLPNRALLHERLNKAVTTAERSQQPFALVLIDLDGFKDINDSLGHAAGDRLLVEVGQRLNERIRKSDTVARLGGDEFCLVINDFERPDQLGSLAVKLLEDINIPVTIDDQRVHVGSSIGIAIYPDDALSAEDLTKNADVAMYHAKESGKNTYQFFQQEMNARAVKRLAMIRDLHKAVEDQAFELYYQPKYRFGDSKLVGMEALIRWRKQSGEMVSPAEFIPCAEESGLILPIGKWLLYEACRQTRKWNRQYGSALRVAVNLSARQFRNTDIVADIIQTLKETGFNSANLELEVTEGILMFDTDAAIQIMNQFRDHGISIAIDDFGTGYSSLNYLKRFPIDTLKIDQSFVRDLQDDSDDAAIIVAIISLAEALSLKVVAEGIETAEQYAFLKEQGCDEAQGYYLGRPMPVDEFENLLAE